MAIVEKVALALKAAGYDATENGTIPGLAPDSTAYGGSEPGSPWDEACDVILTDVQAVLWAESRDQ